jgi:hypothetical protein
MKATSFQGTRCVIALNNIGCLLLEKNCHRQAYATFQDALEVVKCSTEATTDEDEQVYHTKIHNAELRLSSPEVTHGTLPFEPLSYSLSPPSLGYALGVESKTGYHPLRIEVVEADDATITTETLSCILLLNFAIACRSVATMVPSARGARSMDCVLRILTLANVLLEQCDDNSGHSLLLMLVTLDTTKKALLEAGKYMEAEMLQFRLHTIRSYVSSTLSIFLVQQPAAGAA